MNLEATLAKYPARRCAVAGGNVGYRESGGGGTALVLLHGISSGAASWVRQLDGLRDEFRVIAWDAPGYGESSALATQAPLAPDYARVVAELVDALGLARFVLVGHSLGALMASAYATANPARVQRLVLLSPARGYANAEAAEREGKYTRRMEMLRRLGPEGLARGRAAALLSPAAPAEVVAWVASNMRRIHPDGYRQAARLLADDDIGRHAHGFDGPVAVLSGGADLITPMDKCRAVAREFAHATYASLPDAGHALYLEDPERTNAFLRRVAAAASAPVEKVVGA